MTLHWWMHWFWITYFSISVCYCDPISTRLSTDDNSNVEIETTTPTPIGLSSYHYIPRIGKAIGTYPKTQTPTIFSTPSPNSKVSIIFPLPTSSDASDDGSSLQHELAHRVDFKKETEPINDTTTIPPEKLNITLKLPEHIEKIINQSTPNITQSKTSNESLVITPNITSSNKTDNVTNQMKTENVTNAPEKSIKNESLNVVDENDDAEISTVKALSLETAVGRRAVDIPIISESDAIKPDDNSGLDAASISGICFGSIVILALGGAISFVLYRRRYLNKPQTLNDKCSNADSSGYIDDSTIRENSEEMYSLDNDSFLNSLEAMTIQNYWTDSVKHTKL